MRVQVNLSNEMVKEVDGYAKKMGISRSAFCSYIIGQGVLNLNVTYDVINRVGVQAVNEQMVTEVVNTNEEEVTNERN